jgi:hypothetical protein
MRVRRLLSTGAIVLLLAIMFAAGWVVAKTGIGAHVDPQSLTDLERQFTERMHGVAMVGSFTIAGIDNRPARPDRYDISSVEKIGDDRWRFNARMHYGDHDIELPVTLPLRWVGDTPMIMLTDFSIPAMGTFTVRLFFYGDRYAGTWQHGRVGGHMFGRIERSDKPSSTTDKP